MSDVQTRKNAEANRYEAWIGDERAGVAEYELGDGAITFTHTGVDDRFEGKGVGSALARFGLDDAREQGLRVVPRCSFIKGWIDKHPDYADLVG